MAGIDSIINTRADAFTNNPQGLMQRYAMGQDLLDLLALQKLKQDKEAAARSLQMGMQVPQGTIKDQLQGQVMDMTKREVVQAVAPGLQQQGQRMQAEQMQNMMGAGLPTQPAPALQGMAQGGIVGYQEGGKIIGYDGAGNPITQEQLDAITGERRRPSGYAIRQAEKEAMRERAGPELQENIEAAGNWVAENPLEAAGYATLLASGAGEVPALLRLGAAGVQKASPMLLRGAREAGPALMRGIQSLYSKPNPAWYSRYNDKGTRFYPTGVSERLYSPGSLAGTGTGLLGLGYLSDYLFGGEEEQEGSEDTASSGAPVSEGFEPGFRNTNRDTPTQDTPRNVPVSDELAGLAALGPQALRRRPPDVTPASAPTTSEKLDPEFEQSLDMGQEDLAYQRSLNRQHYAAPEAAETTEQPKYRSRYEDRLAEIEAEKQDRMGALIEFLQAAGASGGTNLGATLMGGGSGLRAREERLRQQEADTLKSIIEDENTQAQREFNERQLAQQAAQAAEDRALRLSLFGKEADLRKELAGMDIKSAELIARKRNEMEMELRKLLDANNIRTEDAANIRTEYNDHASRYEEAYKAYVSGTLNDEQKLDALNRMREAEAQLNRLRARLAPQTEIDAQTQADLDRYQQE